MRSAILLAFACGALAGECYSTLISALNLTDFPAPTPLQQTQEPLHLSTSSHHLETTSSSSSLSRPLTSFLHAAADTAHHLTPTWLTGAYKHHFQSSSTASHLETSDGDDDYEDDEEFDELDEQFLLSAFSEDVREWESTHAPCVEACRVRMVPDAMDAGDALCSPLGLQSARKFQTLDCTNNLVTHSRSLADTNKWSALSASTQNGPLLRIRILRWQSMDESNSHALPNSELRLEFHDVHLDETSTYTFRLSCFAHPTRYSLSYSPRMPDM